MDWPAETFVIGATSPATGSSVGGGTTWVLGGWPINRTGTCTQVVIFGAATASVKIKLFTRSGITFTWVSEQTFSVVAGLNTFSPSFTVTAGQYIAIYSATSNAFHFTTPAGVTGTEYYSTAGDVTTSFTVGTTVPPTTGVQLQFNISVHVDDQTGPDSIGNLTYMGATPPALGSLPNQAVDTSYFEDLPLIAASRLETIQAYATAASYMLIFIMTPSSDGYSIYRNFRLTLASGLNTYNAGTDFPIDILIPFNGIIGQWEPTAGLSGDVSITRPYRELDGTVGTGLYPVSDVTSFVSTADINTVQAEIRYGIRRTEVDHHSTTRVDLNLAVATTFNLDFDVTGWSISGGNAVNSANGLGNGVTYRRGGYYDGTVTVYATFTTGSDEIAIYRMPMFGSENLGSVWTINVGTGLLALRALWDGTSGTPAVFQSKTTSLTLATNNLYRFDLVKIGRVQSLTITDTTTSSSDSLTWTAFGGTPPNGTTDSGGGMCVGKPGFAATAGTIHVSEFIFRTISTPTMMMFGDSETQGSGATTDANAWSYQVVAALGGNVLVDSHSGIGAPSVLARIEYVTRQYMPTNVVVFIGTNDTVEATWQAEIVEIVNRIGNAGAVAWLMALPPQASKLWIEQTANPWLRATYPGFVISVDYALTVGRTGLSADLDSTKMLVDLIHPNDIGHAAIFNQFKADAPALFPGTDTSSRGMTFIVLQ